MCTDKNNKKEKEALHIGVISNCADDYGTDKYCTCDKHTYEEHTCPYAEDISLDSDTLCTCCPYCEHKCCMDI